MKDECNNTRQVTSFRQMRTASGAAEFAQAATNVGCHVLGITYVPLKDDRPGFHVFIQAPSRDTLNLAEREFARLKEDSLERIPMISTRMRAT